MVGDCKGTLQPSGSHNNARGKEIEEEGETALENTHDAEEECGVSWAAGVREAAGKFPQKVISVASEAPYRRTWV